MLLAQTNALGQAPARQELMESDGRSKRSLDQYSESDSPGTDPSKRLSTTPNSHPGQPEAHSLAQLHPQAGGPPATPDKSPNRSSPAGLTQTRGSALGDIGSATKAQAQPLPGCPCHLPNRLPCRWPCRASRAPPSPTLPSLLQSTPPPTSCRACRPLSRTACRHRRLNRPSWQPHHHQPTSRRRSRPSQQPASSCHQDCSPPPSPPVPPARRRRSHS